MIFCLATASACSLLFSPSNDPLPLEGVVFDRGEQLSEGRYRHLDYNQGTATFWLRASDPLTSSQRLLDFDGISISINPEDGIVVVVEGAGTSNVARSNLPLLVDGNDHFISLRWDGLNPLSGSSVEGAHVEIRIDETGHSLVFAPYTPQPGVQGTMAIEDEEGVFDIDQLVVYGRPLFVPSNVNDGGELLTMAMEKGRAAIIAAGGFDVLLATAHGVGTNRDVRTFEAWRLPEQELQDSDFPAGNSGLWNGEATLLLSEDRVYRDGGFAVGNTGIENTLQVSQNSSYTLEVLANGFEGSHPKIDISAEDGSGIVSFASAESGSRENPERILLTFETGGADRSVIVTLGADEKTAAFHSVAMRPNLMSDAGFESQAIAAPWIHQFDAVVAPLTFNVAPLYAGSSSACTSALRSQNVLLQEPTDLVDDELYLFGAAMQWRDMNRPGISIDNGSFFAVGGPYGGGNEFKSRATVLAQGPWQVLGTVGRRNLDSSFNAQSDNIRYGSLSYNNSPNSFCVDSAYTLKLETIAPQ